MKLESSRQIFEKYPNIKFHENPSNGSRVVPCGRTDRHADRTKLIVAFRGSVNTPKYYTTVLVLYTVVTGIWRQCFASSVRSAAGNRIVALL